MRIAIITENFLPKLDGVTRTLAMLLEHLEAAGHQALLLGPESGMEQYAGAEVIGTAGVPFPFYPELKFNFFRPLFLRRLKEFSPDVVHLVDPVILGAAGLMAARFLHQPLVSSYHTNLATYCGHFGFPFLTEPMWGYNRLIHNQCSLTFCPSPSTASMLRLQGFQHLRIWPRGVDTTLFRPEKRSTELRSCWLRDREDPAEKVVLLYVGRVSWEKNLRLLVQAYRGMDHDHCHLVIVGDGPASAEMQQELAGLPVTFMGYLRGEALAAAYASADVFAFPSRTETFGQVVLEAMASGLPVVGLFSEGVCDLVTNGRTGLLVGAEQESLFPTQGDPEGALREEEAVVALPDTFGQACVTPIEAPSSSGLGSGTSPTCSGTGWLSGRGGPLWVPGVAGSGPCHNVSEREEADYRQRLVYLTNNHTLRYTMGRAALSDAQKRSWPEAMNCLVQGYNSILTANRVS